MSSPCHHHEVWPNLRVSLALARNVALAAAHPEALALPGPRRRLPGCSEIGEPQNHCWLVVDLPL